MGSSSQRDSLIPGDKVRKITTGRGNRMRKSVHTSGVVGEDAEGERARERETKMSGL